MSESRPTVSERQVARVFAKLADEYAVHRRAESQEATWRKLEGRVMSRWPRTVRRPWYTAVLVPVVAAAAAVLVVLALPGHSRLEYRVYGASAEDGTIRTAEHAGRLDFSDSSVVGVERNTVLNVSIAGEKSALARLSRGQLHVAVHHQEGTDWRFFAGPYEVRVEGTTFDVEWRPENEFFRLAMDEGRVRVLGPDGMARVLTSGQVMEEGARLEVAVSEPPSGSDVESDTRSDAAGEANPENTASAGRSSSRRPRSSVHKQGRAGGESWSKLVAGGKFTDVVSLATNEGIDRVLSSRGAADLRALAQSARYSGNPGLAQRAWKRVRQRFAGTLAGRQAAYFLGRTYEQQGRSADAIRWLSVYLREAPSGVYASEALGQKLMLVRRNQGAAAAEPIAAEYVRRFPKGSYADSARGMLRAE